MPPKENKDKSGTGNKGDFGRSPDKKKSPNKQKSPPMRSAFGAFGTSPNFTKKITNLHGKDESDADDSSKMTHTPGATVSLDAPGQSAMSAMSAMSAKGKDKGSMDDKSGTVDPSKITYAPGAYSSLDAPGQSAMSDQSAASAMPGQSAMSAMSVIPAMPAIPAAPGQSAASDQSAASAMPAIPAMSGQSAMSAKGNGKEPMDDGSGANSSDDEMEEDDHVSKFKAENTIKDNGTNKTSNGLPFNPDIDEMLKKHKDSNKEYQDAKSKLETMCSGSDKDCSTNLKFSALQARHAFGDLLFTGSKVPESLKFRTDAGFGGKYDVIKNDKVAKIFHDEQTNVDLISAFSGDNNVIVDGKEVPPNVRVVTYNASPPPASKRVRDELKDNKSDLKPILPSNNFGHFLEWFLGQEATVHETVKITNGGIKINLNAEIVIIVEGEKGWLEKKKKQNIGWNSFRFSKDYR